MRWGWDVRRYDSGVPVESGYDLFVQRLQPFLTLAFAVTAIVFVRPMGLTGAGLLRLSLIVVSAALLLTVRLPDRLLPLDRRLVVATLAGAAAGALMGLGGQGWAGAFAYMVGVHSGVRFPARVATQVVALTVAIGIVCSLVTSDPHGTPWWANLLVFGSLVPGMTRRTRQLTLAAAHERIVATERAAASEAEARALAERATIARDIHDVLAHSLSGVNMQLSMADALFDAGRPERGREAVRAAQRMVVQGLDEARAAVQTLRGDTVDPVQALAQLASGPQESFESIGRPRPLPSRTVHTLVRVAQEATTNARRHAPGSPVVVRLAYDADRTVLTVGNAAGTGAAGPEGSGLGLVGMRERAAAIGATVQAGPLPADDPAHPGGWLVRLTIPVAPPEGAARD